ncbi:MAG TPA: M23 family metallopeptidase [Bacteroidales bacterium]|jgi:murein DD-endopeptidase MepM/ murein hydrolase activator NlpD|nr:M23 family metallopeptidase [Bacteroidales bacterium]MDI9574629.1 M23 family metallopeptidase [Bacteroidota bacterium]MBP9512155.1 M23 family metallopeptidase [Bacteroidales bacterium]MBP9587499.1 M23 family metallopeptidase [Bacteroidales bacterium]HOE58403.1 M23 family metallopeptidase [Bacteroidales bacterium]
MRRKIRYYFDPLSLTYQIIPVRFRDRLKRILYILAAGLVFSTVVIVLAFKFLSSPKERILQREIEQYKVQVQAMNYELDQMQKILTDLQNRDDNIYRVIFETEPVPASIRQAGIGGANRYQNFEGSDNFALLLETAKKLDRVKSQIYVQSKSFDEVFEMAKKKEAMVTAIPAIQPVSKRDLKYISSYFGYRIHPFYKTVMFHEGIDFTAPKGAKVYATGDGVVKEASLINLDGFGKKIIIEHGFGYQTIYAHLNSFNVKPGQKVKRGDIIATVGTSGLSTGPHLHYEVIYNHQKVNPAYFMFDLDPATFQEIIRQSSDYKESSNIPVGE